MTWTQLHERMALMADLIDRAAESPNSALDFDGYMPDIDRLFGGYEGLLLSLQHRWLTALTAKLDQADHDGVPAEQARAELAAREPGLRVLLDAAARRSVGVRALQRDEQWLVEAFGGVAGDEAEAPRQTVA
jgi:ATP adenylyltransferase